MFPPGLSDVDALVLRCRNGKAKSYLAEAVTCLKAGAFRAAIVVTWVAVVHDLLAKLEQLALAGDKNAQTKLDEFNRIVAAGDIKASLDFERNLLEIARDQFELFGALAHTDLSRLRDDRHRCAHPSMIDSATDYRPSPELARCHIVSAVTHLLEHGPAQGKAAMDRLLADLHQTYFPGTLDELVVHLEHGPLGRPRVSLVRNYIVVLLKELLSPEPASSEGPGDALRARMARNRTKARSIATLQAVLRMHREVAFTAFTEKLDDLVARAEDLRLGDVLALFAAVPDIWSLLSQAQRNRVSRFVREMPTKYMSSSMIGAWAVGDLHESVRARLCRMSSESWKAISAEAPPLEWIAIAVDQLRAATTWGEANPVKEFLVPCAHLLSEPQVIAILDAAASNEKLETSFGMKDVLGALIDSGHLGSGRVVELVEATRLANTYRSEPWWPKGESAESVS
jgi:hypothetical protein